jgi:2-polyprenyl-3-methyl-5-hydroxy-6-metoxy-1,4-benzoquinol methylase
MFCICIALSLYFQPGGSVFITTPNRTIVMWAFGIFLAENVLRVVPQGTHELNKFIKPHEVQALLEKCEYAEMKRLHS